ncbi:type II toxin-antitoxin system HicB family antitoxin [Dactylosporangium roseum]|uniref:Type II toxin-antitoxin system HicB family antitoxin n=1 Tax=Dactylosporangium roseum TaxID=47989 RepID=A0ABY5Z449_9ACTN|nr:type II toxin-antitoxin system HicB family antitoxin [Dactylosporangium roseum]UWZ36232.1 type II toxin-antitoxin system HicB family antitoxin [Dactylosporangium roseum]
MNNYTAVCRRSGDWWAITVPEVKGIHSQVRRLAEAETMVREAIALFLDVAPASFTVTVRPEVPDVEDVLDALRARQEAQQADRRAAEATKKALDRLIADGMTVRDAGRVFDLSPQRVSQITGKGRKALVRRRRGHVEQERSA